MASASKEAEELTRIAKGKGTTLMVAHTFMYNTAFRKMKELVKNGEIGEVVYLNFQRRGLGPIRKDVNSLWDLAPHDISMLIDIVGMPKRVIAKGRGYIKSDREDVVFVIAEFKDGTMANIHTSWLDPYKIRTATIVGSKKMVVFDDVSNEKIRVFDKGVEFDNASSYGEFKDVVRDGDIIIPKIPGGEPLKIECEHFMECINDSKPPISDGENGTDVVKFLEAAQRSLGTGEWETVGE